MNTKWKTILIVMLIIMSICGVFIVLFTVDSRENLRKYIDTEIASIQAIVETIEEANSRLYRNRIQTFVDYIQLPMQEKIINAFARQDREELQRLSFPYFQAFQKENSYFSTFSWLTTDNHAFLRVHRPLSFGDEIGDMRPDIVDANKEHRRHASYMIAKTGLQFRIVQPVSYHEQYIGILQLGLQDNLLLDIIRSKLKLPVGIAITNEKYSFITHSKLSSLAGSTHTIQFEQLDLLRHNIDRIDWSRDQQKIILQGKPCIIANAFNLRNYKEEVQGNIFVILDISKQEKLLQSRINFILLLSACLLLLSFAVLYNSYSSLIQKIMDLNAALLKSNENLEHQVEQRTAKLQKALDDIKSLEGILPLCSYCKKIRNNKDEWEDVDVYIHSHSQADISHSICPECAQKHFPEYFEDDE